MNTQPALVLFSGGKDSFLAASRLAMTGTPVVLLSFNNGAMIAEGILAKSAQRLINRYGDVLVSYAGCYNTAAVFQSMRDWNADTPWSRLGQEYPSLYTSQVTCLLCQTAMWSAAIAYAVAKDIPRLASGYRKSDPFCTGWTGYCNRISDLAAKYGRYVLCPVWNDDTWCQNPGERDYEMARHGFEPAAFEPAAFEPKCTLGRPVHTLSEQEQNDMARCLDAALLDIAASRIEKLIPVFRAIRLSSQSMHGLDYPIPDGSSGLF